MDTLKTPIGNPTSKAPLKKKRRVNSSQTRFVITFLTPIVLLFIIFSFLPILMNFVISLYNYNPLSKHPPFVGLKNFINLFSDKIFIKSLVNTFIFVIVTVGTNVILALIVALSVNSVINRKLKNFYRTFFFLPTVVPIVAVAMIWGVMYNPEYGVVNMFMSLFGKKTMIYWLTSPYLALPAAMIMTLWQDIGYNIVILLAGLESIPKMFDEAAYIDGASKLQVIRKITLPLLKRTTAFVIIMTVISYFQVFAQIQVLTDGQPNYASEVIALHIYRTGFAQSRMGYASAMSVVLLVIIMIVSLIQLKLTKADWEY